MAQPPALRLLLADDLSPAARRAAALIAGSSWPPGTTVRIVSSPVGIGRGPSSLALLSEARAHAREVSRTIAEAHDRIAAELVDAGLSVESRIVHGRPERAIVVEAERFGADLIVVGARDQGPISATLLGSVSRAIVESATTSVLVARGSAASRAVLAVDGSPPAALATTIVASWPMFAGLPTLVVGVGDPPPSYGGMVLGDADWRAAHAPSFAASTHRVERVVAEAVEALAAPGRRVEREIRLGEAGTEIVAAAEAWAADLVALGAYGQPLLRRIILGSVARRVLDGVRASVLVARPREASGRR